MSSGAAARRGRTATRTALGALAVALAAAACTSDDTGTTPTSFRPAATAGTETAPTAVPPAAAGDHRVVRITDGDTLVVADPDGIERDVRLIGINAPERGECLADQATATLREVVGGGRVALEADTTDEDRFGRLLRYVFVDEVFVNAELVEQGLALSNEYEPDTARQGELDAAEARARDAGRGLWAADACGQPTTAEMRIVEVNADAPGDDGQNLNGEWVLVANAGDEPVDLTDWVIKDESASHRYSFPAGFALARGAEVTVFTGCGTDDVRSLYWCAQGSAVWNNSGDTAFLLDPSGNTVDDLTYP